MVEMEEIKVKINADFSLWSAIKMRIAGVKGVADQRIEENEELLKSLIKGLENIKNGKTKPFKKKK